MIGRPGTEAYRLPSDAQRWQVLRGLRAGVTWLARVVTAAAMRICGRRKRELPDTDSEPTGGAALVGESTEVPRWALEIVRPAGGASSPASAATVQRNAVVFDCIVAERDFDGLQYSTVFAELQRGAASKLWDLRGVETLELDLFERLADAWKAGSEAVGHLGVLLDYERWVVLHTVAARRLQPIVERGIAVEIFYDQQFIDTVPAWFAGGRVEHPLPAILEWLRAEWRPRPNWRRVLDTTAMLATGYVPREQVPDYLIQLAAIANSKLGSDGAREALTHLETAMSWIGEEPSGVRCRALRMRAASLVLRGRTHEGLVQLDAAIRTAVLVGDPREEASALADVGIHLQTLGHLARAETMFRRALSRLPIAELPYLRATLHHHLALALCDQRKRLDEAARHATTALGLRWDKDARLAREDRALLERIRNASSVSPSASAESLPDPPRAA